MKKTEESKMTMRLELFVNDLPESIGFYHRVLRFEIGDGQADGYTPVTNGEVQLGLNLRSNLPDDHPVQSKENERLGQGIEIVFEVDDIDEIYEYISAQNWPLANKLQRQPWGLTDFRVLDPDGYYLRFTSRFCKQEDALP
jgi:lactoylglutathione lyase